MRTRLTGSQLHAHAAIPPKVHTVVPQTTSQYGVLVLAWVWLEAIFDVLPAEWKCLYAMRVVEDRTSGIVTVVSPLKNYNIDEDTSKRYRSCETGVILIVLDNLTGEEVNFCSGAAVECTRGESAATFL